jgi:hypothetical protein
MKTIIKLLITVAVINALFRIGMATATYYQFKDASYQIALFAGYETESALHSRVMDMAAAYQVPISPEQVTIRRDGLRTVIEAEYDQPVELFPHFTRSAQVSFKVEAFSTRPETVSDVLKRK